MKLFISPIIVPIRSIFPLMWLMVHLKLLVLWGDTSKQRDPFRPFLSWKSVPLFPEQSGFNSWSPKHFLKKKNKLVIGRECERTCLCVALQKQWQRWNDKEKGQPCLREDPDVEVSGHGGFTGRQQSEALFHSKCENSNERTLCFNIQGACLQGIVTYCNIQPRDLGLLKWYLQSLGFSCTN